MNMWQALVKLVEPFHRRDRPWFALTAIALVCCVIGLVVVIPFATVLAFKLL